MNLSNLNEQYASLSPKGRLLKLKDVFGDNEVLFTSSFGTTSAVLLHMVSDTRPEQTVHFINTTYLFKETIEYKNQLSEFLKLRIVELIPDKKNNTFTFFDRTWEKDADLCCTVNKLMPLEVIKPQFTVWISGLIGHQNTTRSAKNIFEYEDGIIKFYPLIDLTPSGIKAYMLEHGLPQHPLISQGFGSVGCVHCTGLGCGREGRWKGNSKTECGLHRPTIKKAS